MTPGDTDFDIQGEPLLALLQRSDCSLRKLDLRRCRLGDWAVTALAREALVVNTSLRSLCLGGNDWQDTAIWPIAHALRRNAHLQTLDLQYNLSTDTGLAAVAETLQWHNDSLHKIKLRHCPSVSEPMKQYLLDLLLTTHARTLTRTGTTNPIGIRNFVVLVGWMMNDG